VNGSQNKGYGRLLIERAIAEARNEGMRLIRLEVRNENRKAIGFYEHCGFNFEKKSTRTIGSSYYALRIS
jgi:ribosomal protein S18 acetylase RimI-like enzyme